MCFHAACVSVAMFACMYTHKDKGSIYHMYGHIWDQRLRCPPKLFYTIIYETGYLNKHRTHYIF